jgi:hypothetical protein
MVSGARYINETGRLIYHDMADDEQFEKLDDDITVVEF